VSAPKLPGPLPDNLPELVEYAVVRHIFKWKSNDAIRRAVKADKLVRVQVGLNTQAFKITADSVRQLHADMIEMSEACKQFEITPGRMAAMRQAKKQREILAAPIPEVTLDEREIIREAHNLNKTPAPPASIPSVATAVGPQTDNERVGAYLNAKGRDGVTAWRALDWRQRNKFIEAGLAP